jgi:hypothetical protein
MTIERKGMELIIKLSVEGMDTDSIQRLINYLKYRELVSKSKATQAEIDNLASEINKNWWNTHRSKFIKE